MTESRFVVLIPHRDQKPRIEHYRQELFAKGFLGAYSFPIAAPLVQVSRALTKSELKTIAITIRERTMEHEGKITTTSDGKAVFPNMMLFGPCLDIPWCRTPMPEGCQLVVPAPLFTVLPTNTVVSWCRQPLLAAAVVTNEDTLPSPAPFSFRAASVANLVIRPLADDGYSFEWKLGIPVWLPKV